MGIYLDIQGVGSNKVFTPHEAVKGVVRLELDRSTVISDITLSLEGSIRTSLIEKGPAFILGNDVPKVADEKHQLFNASKVLFPHPNTPFIARGYALSEGKYDFPFEISFPLAAECSTLQPALRHRETMLPPSFEAHAVKNGANAYVAYILRAEVTRRTRLRKVTSTDQKVTFLPLDPSAALRSALGTGYRTTQKGLYLSPQNSPGCSRTALPILLLEAKLPSPPVLYPRERLPLQLCVRSLPTRIHHILPIKLQSLAISLRSTTNITANTHNTCWASSRKLLDLRGLDEIIKCDRESDVLLEIKHGPIRSVTVPATSPSFTTCTIEHKHSLEIDAVFSLSELYTLSSVRLVINVEMLSGNESRTGLYAEDPGQDGDAIPLRCGCLAHLGALDTVDRESDPPPY
ncbi:hypothetical protein BJX63DRAFT_60807 [Aspergillus granulosus]|uniref:Arrestin-like N-terminal domain-containing protein n=1 Tax=Aspergillus granulosus TaxID=176169 RepID=A0ABR4GX71_9EURO